MIDYLLRMKKIIINNITDGDCGIFFTASQIGDTKELLYHDGVRTIMICRHWAYFEVLGCTEAEKADLVAFYKNIGGIVD